MTQLSRHLGVLSEPLRVRLLAVLAREELSVGELTRVLQLPQSTVSRHLKALRVAGWVARRSEGTAGWFRLASDEVSEAARQVWELVHADFAHTHQHREDLARLEGELEARRLDSADFFGRTGARWDDLRAELFGRDHLLPTLLSLLPSDLEVADLGCGTGEALAWLAPVVARAVGVDREQAMLDAARLRTAGFANVALHRGRLDDLPLEASAVDAALMMLVLHHVDDPAAALAEARRVVRAGGRLVVLDMKAHDRADWRHTMGHVHLGFSEAQVSEWAARAGWVRRGWRDLRPAPDASGPPLFVAVFSA